jgi:gluconolactonase
MGRDLTVETLVTGFDSPEGPAFDEQGRLYFVNWLSHSIMRIDADGVAREFVNTGGIPAGLAFDREGVLYVADEGDDIHGVLKVTPDGAIAPWVQSYDGKKLNGANDLVFAPDGVLYFSDPWGSSGDKPIGGFYRAFPDGRLEQIDRGLCFPNGVAVSADGSAVFLGETYHNRILRYEILADGSMGERTVFSELGGGPGPDGMAFDAEGRLYVAHYGESRVDVVDPSGKVVDFVPIPGKGVTNCAFGGDDMKTLVVTCVDSQSLHRTRVDVPGQRLYGGWKHT